MGRPGWDHRGLPCEPGRCLCQDIALLTQSPVLTPQTGQLLALGTGRAVLSAAFIASGLTNPVPDRLGGRFKLARQLFRCSPRSHQSNHLSPELRRIGSVTLRHRWHLLLKWKGVHQTGSTPAVRGDHPCAGASQWQFRVYLRRNRTGYDLGHGLYGNGVLRVMGAFLCSPLQSGGLGPRKIKAHGMAWEHEATFPRMTVTGRPPPAWFYGCFARYGSCTSFLRVKLATLCKSISRPKAKRPGFEERD